VIRLAATFFLFVLAAGPARAQFAERASALPPADIDLVDSASAAHLESARRFLAEEQWEEAVESIRRVQEADSSRLVKVEMARPIAGFERFVPAGEYCQWRLAALAKEAPLALAHYRSLVDSLAEQWYREGAARRDERLLARVVEQAFASRWGDDALLRLGDFALARGQPAAARAWWRRIRPELAGPFTADAFPDSDITAADVRSRLVLASIMEGSLARAERELDELKRDAPDAEGTIGGRQGKLAALLSEQLEQAAAWPAPQPEGGWPTLAGNFERDRVAPSMPDIAGRPLWSFTLPRLHSDRELIGAGRLRVAEDGKALLSYHPVVVGNTVLIRCDARRKSLVIALDLLSGQELWRIDYERGVRQRPGDQPDEPAEDAPLDISDVHANLARHVGVARYTASVVGDRAFVRMGSPITFPTQDRTRRWLAKDQGFLLGLDLRTQGKPLEGFPIRPESNTWSFEGTPVSDGSYMYVAMRRSEGSRSQIYVAAYELQTASAAVDDEDDDARPGGRLVWRTRICSSATLLDGASGDGLSHLLLSMRGGHLYLNTSAGVVAAIRAQGGQVRWLVKYPRSAFTPGDADKSNGQFFRDLTPCLLWKDLAIVAPSDSDRLFALEAATGQLAWSLPPEAASDAIHLLGIGQETLLASGNWLYWIDANTGRLLTQFPQAGPAGAMQAAPSPRGMGRGVLAGQHVIFPTRESLLVFDQRPVRADLGWQPRQIREIPLVPRGVTGGNVVIANGVLLIATGDRLVAFGE
jgi:outer membrane protein assembly factor BamB